MDAPTDRPGCVDAAARVARRRSPTSVAARSVWSSTRPVCWRRDGSTLRRRGTRARRRRPGDLASRRVDAPSDGLTQSVAIRPPLTAVSVVGDATCNHPDARAAAARDPPGWHDLARAALIRPGDVSTPVGPVGLTSGPEFGDERSSRGSSESRQHHRRTRARRDRADLQQPRDDVRRTARPGRPLPRRACRRSVSSRATESRSLCSNGVHFVVVVSRHPRPRCGDRAAESDQPGPGTPEPDRDRRRQGRRGRTIERRHVGERRSAGGAVGRTRRHHRSGGSASGRCEHADGERLRAVRRAPVGRTGRSRRRRPPTISRC